MTRDETHLEEVLAQVVGDHEAQGRELADAPAADLERDVEQAERHEAHRVGVLLVVRVEERDEDAQELLDRREAERCDVGLVVCEGLRVSAGGSVRVRREREDAPLIASPSTKPSFSSSSSAFLSSSLSSASSSSPSSPTGPAAGICALRGSGATMRSPLAPATTSTSTPVTDAAEEVGGAAARSSSGERWRRREKTAATMACIVRSADRRSISVDGAQGK